MDYSLDRVPLVVGVTGHRDLRLQDIPALESQVGAVIQRLRNDYLGASTETPLVLISALAEGADRLAARVALANGMRLIAPLPLPCDEYRRDFEPGLKPGAAAEFDELLSQAASVPVMPFAPGNSLEAIRSNEHKRAEQYRAVGLFIVQHCDVLIALWDGDDKEMAAGGTAEVVSFKRRGIPLSVSGSANFSLDGSEIGPVIHVLTPRIKTAGPGSVVSVQPWGKELIDRHCAAAGRTAIGRIYQSGAGLLEGSQHSGAKPNLDENRELSAWQVFDVLASLTHEFNEESAALTATEDGRRRAQQSTDHLFTDFFTGRLADDARDRALSSARLWCKLYGIADSLAQNRQAKFKGDWLLLFTLGFVAFVLFALAHLGHNPTRILIAYGIAVLVFVVVFFFVKMTQNQERFLDYRAFAEALRVAVYWGVLGIDHRNNAVAQHGGRIGSIADCYPIKQPSELAWVKICLRKLERLQNGTAAAAKPQGDREAHGIARRFWVHGQLSYFSHQGVRHDRSARRLEGAGLFVLCLTPLCFVPVISDAIGGRHFIGFGLHDIALVATGIVPGLAAALTSYSERLGLKAQASQYDRMQSLFKRAYELLPEHIGDRSNTEHIWSLYYTLGVEAMKEHADWVAIYRQRPIRLVQ